jgi:hypothetical protein
MNLLKKTKFQATSSIMEFLNRIINELDGGLLKDESKKDNFKNEIEKAIADCEKEDEEGVINSIDNLFPMIKDFVIDYNKPVFLDLISQALFCITHEGEFAVKAPSTKDNVGECTTITIMVHFTTWPLTCQHVKISAHIESVEITPTTP